MTMAGSEGEAQSLLESDAEILSVSALNSRISEVLDQTDRLQGVTVQGEVTSCSASNVALYFTLTDGTEEIQCLLWQRRYRELDVEIEDGIEVILTGNVDYYGEHGRLDIKPWQVYAVGDGDQHAELERLRAELADRGWFADEAKQPLPDYPTTVGVVTSKNGDARYDIQDAIHSRYPDVDIVIEHASVQGENAPPELATGIECLDLDSAVDVIITGRGGGSDTDLMAFNTELVADTIFHADTPIVAAVGHRADETIADSVADQHAMTPTAAGELVVKEKDVVLAGVEDRRAELLDVYESRTNDVLTDLENGLADAYTDTVESGLADLESRLSEAYTAGVQTRLASLSNDLTDAYERVEHEHEKQAAVEAAREEAAAVPTAYKVAIVVLLVLLAILGIAILALVFL